MKNAFLGINVLVLLVSSCSDNDNRNDAFGVFEATEVVVSSEANGKILDLNISEGDQVEEATSLGLIDSTQLHLSKLLLLANKNAVLSSKPDVKPQIEATQKEIDRLKNDKNRIIKLLEGDVATQKQLDDINAQIDILEARLSAQKSTLNTSVNTVNQNSYSIDVKIKQLNDQIDKCIVSSPISGTILVKYVEKGELTAIGKPMFKVANLDEIILKSYISGEQLHRIKLGETVMVNAEFGKEDSKEYEGIITWISSNSEFTPKSIQTQNERANLVYAVKVKVQNDGFLKIGMYGGFNFNAE